MYGTPVLQPLELPILSNSEMPFRRIFLRAVAITIRFTGETSKMSWAELPVEPACMGKAVGEAGRPLMLCGARLYIIT